VKIDLMTRAFASGGGGTIYYVVAAYLQSALGSYGESLSAIEVVVCFRGGKMKNGSLQRMYDEYHSRFLPSLPYLKFARKKRRFYLTYETEVADATLLDRRDFLSADLFRQALTELAQRFKLLDARIKKADKFDVARYHADVTKLAAQAPRTDAELQALKLKLDAENEARRAALSEWDQLEVEWEDFHPTARQLLDSPFFWDVCEEYSPHGNDTGSDTLSNFLDWNERNAESAAHMFAPKLLARWGVPVVDLGTVDTKAVTHLLQDNAHSVAVIDDVLIAIAFAAIKTRGFCDEKTKKLALAAIGRERMPASIALRGWTKPEERLRTLGLIQEALERVPKSLTTPSSARRRKGS